MLKKQMKVWVPSKQTAWDLGKVVFVDELSGEVKVEIEEKSSIVVVSFHKNLIHITDDSHFKDFDDLCDMNFLHEAPLLACLDRRFLNNYIYTTTGDVLISVNPYKIIPGLYETPMSYLDLPEDGDMATSAAKPHVYKVANAALADLLYRGKRLKLESSDIPINQSIIVSGESGSGKTEASKRVMSFLIDADKENRSDGSSATNKGDVIRKVLMESNIILEAFGNSKTVRNDNSSRFGKYIKLQYSPDSRIVSAFTETFLLEKSRLVSLGANERNYHVFYLLFYLSSIDKSLMERLHLTNPSDFKILVDSNGVAISTTDDSSESFSNLSNALSTLGCNEQELQNIWTTLACILHMGNIQVESVDSSSTEFHSAVKILSKSIPIEKLTALMGLSVEKFEHNITHQRVQVSGRSSISMKTLNASEVQNSVNALLKWMYSSLFMWLVRKINMAHTSISANENVKATKFIGILDIFGFEILQNNSFEQLCINFTNERLQSQFNEYVFDREQSIYISEGLSWNTIQYKDNQHVIDMIAKKPNGLLNILEAQGLLNRGSSEEGTLLNHFNQAHDKKSVAYEKSRFGTDGKFTIKHFAGDVTYSISGFLDKNNDSLQDDLLELMFCSSNEFTKNAVVAVGSRSPLTPDQLGYIPDIPESKVVSSFSSTPAKQAESTNVTSSKKMASTLTVSYQFRSQLDLLILSLKSTSPHFIKCLKPNTLKSPDVFDRAMILEQLRYSGALEVVRIRQEGYPVSLLYNEFYSSYEILVIKGRGAKRSSICSVDEAKTFSTQLCSDFLTIGEFQFGINRLFLRSTALEKLQQAMSKIVSVRIIPLQSFYRGRFWRKKYLRIKKTLVVIQSLIRMFPKKKRHDMLVVESRQKRKIEIERIAEVKRLEKLAADKKVMEEEEYRKKLEEEKKKQDAINEDNKRLIEEAQKDVEILHKALENGNLSLVETLLESNAENFASLNPMRNNCTIYHSAAVGCNLPILEFLCPTVKEILLKDSLGNNVMHYVAASNSNNKIEAFRYLSSRIDQVDLDVRMRPLSIGKIITLLPKSDFEVKFGKVIKTTQASLEDASLNMMVKNYKSMWTGRSSIPAAVNYTSGILKAGWLSKRGESQTWRKRWVVLTKDSLMYFRNETDKLPRDTLVLNSGKSSLSIEIAAEKPNAIDIYSGSTVKKRDRVSLMADSFKEIQIWLFLIKSYAGIPFPSLRQSPPIAYINPILRQSIFSMVNDKNESILHTLAANSTNDEDNVNTNLQTISWLRTNGCPMNLSNYKGLSALHVALQRKTQKIAIYLAGLGLNPITSTNIINCKETVDNINSFLAENVIVQELLNSAFMKSQSNKVFFSSQVKLKGFSYLSLHILQHKISSTPSFIDTSALTSYYLNISVCNAQDRDIEAPQKYYVPIVSKKTSSEQLLLWLYAYHLQAPLDIVDDGSYLVISFNKDNSNGSSEILSWTCIDINKKILNSEVLTLNLSKGQIDKKKNKPDSDFQSFVIEFTISKRDE